MYLIFKKELMGIDDYDSFCFGFVKYNENVHLFTHFLVKKRLR